MTAVIWLNNPMVLFKKEHISEFWPLPDMSLEEKINAITRLVVLLTLLGFLISQSMKILITGGVTLAILAILYYTKMNKDLRDEITPKKIAKEGFTNPKIYESLKDSFTQPTMNNPLMNVQLPELNGNPHRKPAAPAFNPEVEKKINDATKKQIIRDSGLDDRLFKNLGENFVFDQSMRNFYSTANTRVPNDQTAFAEYCYGDMPSCKEGNEFACVKKNYRYTNY